MEIKEKNERVQYKRKQASIKTRKLFVYRVEYGMQMELWRIYDFIPGRLSFPVSEDPGS